MPFVSRHRATPARPSRSAVARLTLLIALLLPALYASVAAARVDPPDGALDVVSTTSAPLTVHVDDELNSQIDYGNLQGQIFPYGSQPANYSTFLRVGNALYGSSPRGQGVRGTAYTPVSQTAVTGSGSSADPFKVVTVVSLGATGLQIEQTDSYINGEEAYRTDIAVINAGATSRTVSLYRGMDCYLSGVDSGYGWLASAAVGSPACAASPANTPPGIIEQLYPLSPGASYIVGYFADVWAAIVGGDVLPNTVVESVGGERYDNGQAIAWRFDVPAGGAVTRSHLSSFSPTGKLPLPSALSASPATVAAGGTAGYTLTIQNPNVQAVSVGPIVATLPAGFSYAPGSTTGATTGDPTIAGQTVTWGGPFNVGAGGTLTLGYSVVVGNTDGSYGTSVRSEAAAGYLVIPVVGGGAVSVTGGGIPVATVTSPAEGGWVRLPRPIVRGTTDPSNVGATVTVTNGGATVCTAIVAADGSWSCTPTVDLPDGDITIIVQVDTGSGTSGTTERRFHVDTVAPAAPTITLPAQGATVSGLRPAISGTAPQAEAGGTVKITAGGVAVCSATVAADGSWSCTPTVDLPAGPVMISATLTDKAGNVSGPATRGFTVVDANPVAAPQITAPADGAHLNNRRAPISGTADPQDAGGVVTVSASDKVVCTATVTAAGTWSCAPTSDLPLGSVIIQATVSVDTRTSPADSVTVTIDVTDPAPPTITAPAAGATNVALRPAISGTADPAEAGATVNVTRGGVLVCSATVAANGTWSCTPTSDLPAGSVTISAVVVDRAGNDSGAATRTFTVGSGTVTPPAAPTISSPAAGTTVTTRRPAISGTASPAGATVTVKVGATTVCTATVTTGGTWSCTPTSDLPAGSVTVSATVMANGATSTAATRTFTVSDGTTTPPAAPAYTSPMLTNLRRPTIAGTGPANTTLTLVVTVGGSPVSYSTAVSAAGVWSVSLSTATPASGALPAGGLADGSYPLSATVRNGGGQTSAAATATLRVDATAPPAPVIVSPPAGTKLGYEPVFTGTAEANTTLFFELDLDNNAATANSVVFATPVSASGTWLLNTNVAVPVSGIFPADGLPPLSKVLARATARDAAGNISPPASRLYDVAYNYFYPWIENGS